MHEIIFDSEFIETDCSVQNDGIKIDTIYKNSQNPTSNSFQLKYDREPSNELINKLYHAEKIFLNRLMNSKNDLENRNKKCWIHSLDGKKIFHNFTKDKIINHRNFRNILNFSFNNKLKIEYNNQDIGIEKFKQLLEHKNSKLNINIMLYAIIHSTNDNTNIYIKLKITKIKILELTECIEHTFNLNHNMMKSHYEYVKMYQTSKKKIIGNILQLFKENKLK